MLMKNKTKRRIEISIETHEIKTIRISGGGTQFFCASCGSATSSFSPEEIAQVLKISVGDVFSNIQAGRFHLTEPGSGRALICGGSLWQ